MTGTIACGRPAARLRGVRGLYVLAALLLLAPAPAIPQEEEPWYTVELIVFERPFGTGLYTEAWPAEPGLPDLSDAVELDAVDPLRTRSKPTHGQETPAPDAEATPLAQGSESGTRPPGAPLPFQTLPPEEYELTAAQAALEKSDQYRVLLHVAWRQPGFPEADARLTHVRNDNGALGRARGDPGRDRPTATVGAYVIPRFSARTMVARDLSRAALDGTIKLHRARYLHVKADLLYYRPMENTTGESGGEPRAPKADSTDTALVEQLLAEATPVASVFRLTESRRMRSGELHYLDHPLFGVLVQVRPYELPQESILPVEPAAEEADQAAGKKAPEGG